MLNRKTYTETMQKLESGTPPAADAGFLGADLDPAEARLVIIPVPWEATVSYRGGTAQGPRAMLKASHQLDLEDAAFGTPYRAGITFLPEAEELNALNKTARSAALHVISALEQGELAPAQQILVNEAGQRLNEWVYQSAKQQLAAGKHVALAGGDHSSPYGLIQALAEHEPDGFGILHIDAHHDLRAAYEGCTWSHASIFYNVMENLEAVSRLVQVGVRDYCREERLYLQKLGARGHCFYGSGLFRMKAEGLSFAEITRKILTQLPEAVYISFDIDGLDPPYCPSTGTPVPGGLSFDEAAYLLEELAAAGHRVIGFDLCEVAPGQNGDEWDANVGARLLYKLCGCLLRSRDLCYRFPEKDLEI